jgi:hypothetical protein
MRTPGVEPGPLAGQDPKFGGEGDTGLDKTTQVLWLLTLRLGLLSPVACSCPLFRHRSGIVGHPKYPPRVAPDAGPVERRPGLGRALSHQQDVRGPDVPPEISTRIRSAEHWEPHGPPASRAHAGSPAAGSLRSKRVSLTLHSMTADGAPSTSRPTRTRAFSSGCEYSGPGLKRLSLETVS